MDHISRLECGQLELRFLTFLNTAVSFITSIYKMKAYNDEEVGPINIGVDVVRTTNPTHISFLNGIDQLVEAVDSLTCQLLSSRIRFTTA